MKINLLALLRRDAGTTIVEFALTATIFFAIIFGIMEFGIGVWRYNLVADLSQEGARWASVRGKNVTPATSAADVQAYVESRALGIPVTVTASNPSALDSGDTVSVQVSTTFTPLTTLIPHSALTLTSTSQMIMSR